MAATDYFKQGQRDARSYHASQAFTGLSRFLQAEAAMKLYWPPVEESMVMFSSPLPSPRQKWLAGFRQERLTILAEQVIACRTCGQNLPTTEEGSDNGTEI